MHPATSSSPAGARRPAAGVVPGAVLALLALVLLVAVPGRTEAAFVSTTADGTNAFTTAATFPDYPTTVGNDGPVLHHRFDDAPPSTAAVDSRGGASGTYGGTTGGSPQRTGPITGSTPNTAVNFTAGSYASADASMTQNLSSGFSLEVWVRSSSGGPLLGSGGSATGPAARLPKLYVDQNGHVCLALTVTPSGGSAQTWNACETDGSDLRVDDGAWHHVVVSVDPNRATAADQLLIFVDGLQQQSEQLTGALATSMSGYWRLGAADLSAAAPSAPQTFTGSLDEAAVYSYGLSTTQMANHYAARTGGYGTSVRGDSPQLFWRLSDAVPLSVLQDASTHAVVGHYYGFPNPDFTLSQAGALQGAQAGSTAVMLMGTKGIYNGVSRTPPATSSLEVWFKSPSGGAGGPLAGFGSSTTGASASRGRTVYLAGDGRICFAVGSTPTIITSPGTYSDGAWHMATATVGPSGGMRLYVDGALVQSNTSVTAAPVYAGYWRWGGGDSYTGWSPAPGATYFTGWLDEASVYSTELSAEQVAVHYGASR